MSLDLNSWFHTRSVLGRLNNLLECGICECLVRQPCQLGGCEHYFCRTCVDDLTDSRCPVCCLPSHRKDLQTNRSLERAVSLCKSLSRLLALNDDDHNNDTKEDPEEKQQVPRSVFEFQTSPEDGADETSAQDKASTEDGSKKSSKNGEEQTGLVGCGSPANVSQRTRKNTKIRMKKKQVADNNEKWGIGKTTAQKCTSCKRACTSEKRRVQFRGEKLLQPQFDSSADDDEEEAELSGEERIIDEGEEPIDEERIFNEGEEPNGMESISEPSGEDRIIHEEPNINGEGIIETDKDVLMNNDENANIQNKIDQESMETCVINESKEKCDQQVCETDLDSTKKADKKNVVKVEETSRLGKKTSRSRGKSKQTNMLNETTPENDAKIQETTDGDVTASDQNMEIKKEKANSNPIPRPVRSSRKRPSSSPVPNANLKKSSKADPSPQASVSITNSKPDPSPQASVTPTSSRPTRAKRTSLERQAVSNAATGSKQSTPQSNNSTPQSGRRKSTNRRNSIGRSPAQATPTSSRGRSSSAKTTPTIQNGRDSVQATPLSNSGRSSRVKSGRDSLEATPLSRSGRSSGLQATPLSGSRRSLSPGRTSSPAVKKNAKGETPLHIACIKGDVSEVERLLREGAPVNVKDNAGWTPLHEASNHGHHDIVSQLLESGALINMPGMDHDTPLHDAVSNGRLECVRLLVSRGADINARNIHGKTPVDQANTSPMRKALNTPVDSQLADTTINSLPASQTTDNLVLLGTTLSRDEKIKLTACAKLLNGKIVSDFSHAVSHVITCVNGQGQCPRTLKYLQAVLAGKWVLNISWVETCVEYQQRVSEEAFEVPGTSSAPDSLAPMLGRNNVNQQLPGLFSGCSFYLRGDFIYPTPSKDDLTTLLKLGGGKILAREPRMDSLDDELEVPYHAEKNSPLANCCYYIIQDNRMKTSVMLGDRMCEVPASWVMDSIASFRLIDLPN